MSELTPCNYCNLRRLERSLDADTQAVDLRAGTGAFAGMISVFVVDRDPITGVLSDPAPDTQAGSHFMALSTRCVC